MNSSRSQSTARAASAPAPARERRPVVLVVDDEAAITLSLRSFLTRETDYEVHTFESPLSALAALPRLRPDLVISDFLMPELDGLSLSRARAGDRRRDPARPPHRLRRQGECDPGHQRDRALPLR